jgi:hypothetical protein
MRKFRENGRRDVPGSGPPESRDRVPDGAPTREDRLGVSYPLRSKSTGGYRIIRKPLPK